MKFLDNSRIILRCLFLSAIFLPLGLSAQSISGGQAALFLSPSSGSFLVGSNFDISIVLDTKGVAVNTVEVELNFPPDKLQLVSPSVSGPSIIQIWPTAPAFSNQEGKIYFVGGIPSPGITTSQGVVLTLNFRAISSGEARISFGGKTSVLANDGKGTNILRQKPSAFFKFLTPPPLGPEISSPTHPDQERWYRDTNPVFNWPKNERDAAYSYSLDQDPSGFPDTTPEGSAATASFENLDNGIWYLHLRARDSGVWGGVSHYIVKIDSQPPADFKIDVSPSLRTNNQRPVFRFFTTDAFSGFDHFEMKIIPLYQEGAGQQLFFETVSPYQSQSLSPGRYQVVVRAVDRAGNSRDASETVNILNNFRKVFDPEGIDLNWIFIPWTRAISVLGLLALFLFITLIVLWRRHRHHLKHAFAEDIKSLFGFFKKNEQNPSQ